MDNNDGACLDAAVIAINGLAVADRGITEADGLLLGHEEFDVITKPALTQLSHQTKKYDLKSKHCGAQSDLGTTRAKVVEALTEVRRKSMVQP